MTLTIFFIYQQYGTKKDNLHFAPLPIPTAITFNIASNY